MNSKDTLSRAVHTHHSNQKQAQSALLAVLLLSFFGFIAGAYSNELLNPTHIETFINVVAYLGIINLSIVGFNLFLPHEQNYESSKEPENTVTQTEPSPTNTHKQMASAYAKELREMRNAQIRDILTCQKMMQLEELNRFKLTEQELVIAEHLLNEEMYSEIAQQLCLAESTVRTHVRNICAKANVKSSREFRSLIRKNMERVLH